MKSAALRLLEEDARFRAAVREGIAQADRGRVYRRIGNERTPGTNAEVLKMQIRWTPAAASDLQLLSDYLREHPPHYQIPTLRKIYDSDGLQFSKIVVPSERLRMLPIYQRRPTVGISRQRPK